MTHQLPVTFTVVVFINFVWYVQLLKQCSAAVLDYYTVQIAGKGSQLCCCGVLLGVLHSSEITRV